MDFLQEVLTSSEDDIKNLVQGRIKELVKESLKINGDVPALGFVPSSPMERISTDGKSSDIDKEDYYDDYSVWYGFIPKGKRIVYQIDYDDNYFFTDKGHYCVMDSDEYIYDFIDYFKAKQVDIKDPYEMIYHVFYFLNNYFGEYNINRTTRDRLHTFICDKKGNPIESSKEHSILDFKGRGAAMCTEYSALSCNILSLFGFSTVFLGGECDGMGHNYTIVSYDEEDECRIVDMAMPVIVYNMQGDFVRYAPFVQTFEKYDDEAFSKFLDGNLNIVVNDYFWIESDNLLYKFEDEENKETRTYSVDGDDYEEDTPPKSLII